MGKSATDTEIKYLPGVGPRRAELLHRELGVDTFGDLIRLYPFRYIDRSTIIPISAIVPDMAYVQIRARVTARELFGPAGPVSLDYPQVGLTQDGAQQTDSTGTKAGELHTGMKTDGAAGAQQLKFNTIKRMSVLVADAGGQMELVFFKGIKWMYSKLKPGEEYIFFGKPTVFNGHLNMVHPEVDNVQQQDSKGGDTGGFMNSSMTGVYPGSEKLRNGGITGKVMNRLMEKALMMALPDMEETLPQHILVEKGLVPLHFAVRNIHFPKDAAALEKARYRLKFEELFYLQLSLLKQKYVRSRNENGIRMPKVGEAFNICYSSLPFPLTGAQKRVITEIRDDMKSGHQMNRLLQGDVGSGKTMVAVLSALIAVGNGYQACIMAPTEVLAQQHFRNISRYLSGTGVKTALLTGSSTAAERREIHSGLEDGSTGIIVGTHALFEDNVVFRNLGLAL